MKQGFATLKGRLMRHSDVIVLGAAGWGDAALPIAACRAGARGFLDLEFASRETARSLTGKLGRFAGAGFGLKVGPEGFPFLAKLLSDRPAGLTSVLLAGGDHPELPRLVEQLHAYKVEALLEAVTLVEA